jgi:hypothetical protein
MTGASLFQGSMRSDAIVIVGVGFQDPTQMHLAQDNDVVHTFTPDRSDQPFHKAILPRRGWCGGLVPDAHGAQSARDDAAIDPVAIADEVVRSLIPGKCLRYLTCSPFGRWIRCDAVEISSLRGTTSPARSASTIGTSSTRPPSGTGSSAF